MSTSQGMLEDQSITRPPYSKGQHHSLWIKRMEDLLQDDEDEMAIKFKNFKKAKENSNKKNSGKPKNSVNRSKHPPEAAMGNNSQGVSNVVSLSLIHI